MEKLIVFVHVQDKAGVTELTIPATITAQEIVRSLDAAGIEIDKESLVFVNDDDAPIDLDSKEQIKGLTPASHLIITHCKKVKVTVHFQDKTIEHAFAPGVRVRAVKKWAVEKFNLNPTDAGEHVLQLCGSTNQPPTDTQLAKLTDGRTCAVCFDLVPEKRVEG